MKISSSSICRKIQCTRCPHVNHVAEIKVPLHTKKNTQTTDQGLKYPVNQDKNVSLTIWILGYQPPALNTKGDRDLSVYKVLPKDGLGNENY